MKAMQGVNLGGWLIPERWLTPSLFKGTDAKDIATLLQTSEGRARYQSHLEEFIVEDDFRWLAEHGVELLRLPVGYWALELIDNYPSTKKQIDWVMSMAEKYQLKVLLDLHAARGSQNGEMHSGALGNIGWQTNREYQEQAREVLLALALRYRDSPALWGIELLNEPTMGRHYFTLLRFYRQTYHALTEVLRPGTVTVFHDAFHPWFFSGALRAQPQYPVVMDMHLYALPNRWPFTISLAMYERIRKVLLSLMIRVAQFAQPVMIGEWSSVLPQKLFDTTPRKIHPKMLKSNIAAQQRLYSRTTAQVYWNYKAEGEGMWNFRSLVERGDLVVH